MTEFQKKYKTDQQINFEERLLADKEFFGHFAMLYLDSNDEDREGFLAWCWENRKKAAEVILFGRNLESER